MTDEHPVEYEFGERSSDLALLLVAFVPFKNQRWYHHVLLLAGGFAVWAGSYVAVMEMMEWTALAAADSAEGRHVRRWGAGAANFATFFYFGLLLLWNYGGPGLSIFLYPVGVWMLTPSRIYALSSNPPADIYRVETLTANPFSFLGTTYPMALGYCLGMGLFFICAMFLVPYILDKKWTVCLASWCRGCPDFVVRLMYADDRRPAAEYDPPIRELLEDVNFTFADEIEQHTETDESAPADHTTEERESA